MATGMGPNVAESLRHPVSKNKLSDWELQVGKYSFMATGPFFFLFFVLVCFWVPAHAAEWDVNESLGVSVQQIYSDNIDRTPEGGDSSLSTRVTVRPAVVLMAQGARASVDLTGSLGYQIGGTDRSFDPRLDGRANVELLRDHLFLDATAAITENVVDPFGDITLDNINDTGNTTISYRFSFSPYYKTRFSDVADLTARYKISTTLHSEDGAAESGDQNFSVSLNSGEKFSALSWGLKTDYRLNSYADESDREFVSTDASVGYRFNRKWLVSGTLGREWNDYESDESTIGGFRWTVNTNWTPNPRASLRIGYGGRYFGSTPSLDFSYNHRRSVATLSYSRIVTDSNEQLATLQTDPVTGAIFPVATLTNTVFVDERITGTYTLNGKRSSLSFSATNSRQNYQDGSRDSELSKLGVSLSRSFTHRVRGSASLNWFQQDRAANDSANTLQATLGLSMSVGQRTSLSANYFYSNRDADQSSESYEENRISLGLHYTL